MFENSYIMTLEKIMEKLVSAQFCHIIKALKDFNAVFNKLIVKLKWWLNIVLVYSTSRKKIQAWDKDFIPSR